MEKFDFKRLPDNNSTYGRKNIDNAVKNIENNKGLIEVAKRLVDQ